MKYRRIRIYVTRDDLEKAERNKSNNCAVARALVRTYPDIRHVDVDTASVRFTDDDGRWWWASPDRVAQYVSDFDAGLPIGDDPIPGIQCGPFSFELRDPIRQPQRKYTDTGTSRKQDYNAHVAAIREYVGVTSSEWRRLTRDERRDFAAAARAAGIATYEVGERSGLEPSAPPETTALRARPKVESDRPERVHEAPPRVFRTKSRAYGHRLLRWNRPPDDAASGAVR